jgi:flagella basal body P-ring formation protein FlgA
MRTVFLGISLLWLMAFARAQSDTGRELALSSATDKHAPIADTAGTKWPAKPAERNVVVSVACLTLLRPVRKNEALSVADVQSDQCLPGETLASGLHYDRWTHLVRASVDLPAGQPLPWFQPRFLAQFRKGDEVVMSTKVGPITVIRQGVAIQDGVAGHRVFVKTGSGDILSAPIAAKDQ